MRTHGAGNQLSSGQPSWASASRYAASAPPLHPTRSCAFCPRATTQSTYLVQRNRSTGGKCKNQLNVAKARAVRHGETNEEPGPSADAMVAERAESMWPSIATGPRCIHAFCKHSGAGMRAVPSSASVAVAKVVRPQDHSFIERVRSQDKARPLSSLYLCNDHLDLEKLHLGAGAVLPFTMDPVVTGHAPDKRNENGDDWWKMHSPPPSKPSRKFSYTLAHLLVLLTTCRDQHLMSNYRRAR
jgi:hypothetical protein